MLGYIMKQLQQQELELWERWKNTGDNSALNSLVTSYQPVVNKTLSKYQTVATIPRSALEAQSKKLLIDGFKTYDPNKGTALNTHIINYQKGLYRYVTQNKDFVRMPEHRARKVGLFINVNEQLKDKLDREPTSLELAEELSWDINEVERMSKEIVKDLIQNQGGEDGHLIAFKSFDDFGRQKEILEMLYYDLDPEEKLVYEYIYGVGGKPQLETTGEIASMMGVSESKIRVLKSKISEKFKNALHGM